MSDFPGYVTPTHIHTYSRFSLGLELRPLAGTGSPGNVTWTANTAVYMPLSIPWPYNVKRVFWNNGGTVASTNVDFGIYTLSGVRIYSTGSTAMSGATSIQYVTPTTPFLLPAGSYLLAWNCDNTTNRAYGVAPTAPQGALMGCLSQAVGAVTLPATATFATFGAPGVVVCGITRTTTGF